MSTNKLDEALIWSRMFDRSLEHFEEVKRLSPMDAASYSAIGLIQMHQGKIEGAITNLHRV